MCSVCLYFVKIRQSESISFPSAIFSQGSSKPIVSSLKRTHLFKALWVHAKKVTDRGGSKRIIVTGLVTVCREEKNEKEFHSMRDKLSIQNHSGDLKSRWSYWNGQLVTSSQLTVFLRCLVFVCALIKTSTSKVPKSKVVLPSLKSTKRAKQFQVNSCCQVSKVSCFLTCKYK